MATIVCFCSGLEEGAKDADLRPVGMVEALRLLVRNQMLFHVRDEVLFHVVCGCTQKSRAEFFDIAVQD